MWWGKGTPLPPLATTSTDPADGGVIGQPTTTILFGNELVNEEVQAGGRVIWGLWLDRDHNVAATGRFFGLGGDSESFTSDPGLAVLARPFNNAVLVGFPPDALPITSPGLVEGTINATARTDNIISAEAGLEIMMHRDRLRRVDLIAGYQFLRLDDSLQIDSFSTVIGGGPPVGTTFALSDRFATENEFHGGTIGLKSRMARGRWSLDGMVKAAFGSSRQHVSIVGFGEQTIPPGGPTPLNGGFLALPTNIGEYERSRFVVIPEVTINLKYHVTPNSAFHIGYNFIWMSEVVLSGDQIDTTLNLTQQAGPLVGPARPAFNFRDQDYWLQGLNFGWSWEF
jgi:hypothetical protein